MIPDWRQLEEIHRGRGMRFKSIAGSFLTSCGRDAVSALQSSHPLVWRFRKDCFIHQSNSTHLSVIRVNTSQSTTISKTKSKGEGTVTVLLSRPAFGMDWPNSEVVEPVCLHCIGFHLYITLLLWCLTRKAGIRPASKSTAFEMEVSAWTILELFLHNTISGVASLCDCILHLTKKNCFILQ